MKYHGGTNFGRTSGGPFVSTSYDYEAPIDEYGEFFTLVIIIAQEILHIYMLKFDHTFFLKGW